MKAVAIFLISLYLASLIKVPPSYSQTNDVKKFLEGGIFCVKDAIQIYPDIYRIVCLISSKDVKSIKFEFGPLLSFGKMEFLGYIATDDIFFLRESGNVLEFSLLPSERLILVLNIKANFKPSFKVISDLNFYEFKDVQEFIDTIDLIQSFEELRVLKDKCEELYETDCKLTHFIKNSNLDSKYLELSDLELNQLFENRDISKVIEGKSFRYVFYPENSEVKVYENQKYLGNFSIYSTFLPEKKQLTFSDLIKVNITEEEIFYFLNREIIVRGDNVTIIEYADLGELEDRILLSSSTSTLATQTITGQFSLTDPYIGTFFGNFENKFKEWIEKLSDDEFILVIVKDKKVAEVLRGKDVSEIVDKVKEMINNIGPDYFIPISNSPIHIERISDVFPNIKQFPASKYFDPFAKRVEIGFLKLPADISLKSFVRYASEELTLDNLLAESMRGNVPEEAKNPVTFRRVSTWLLQRLNNLKGKGIDYTESALNKLYESEKVPNQVKETIKITLDALQSSEERMKAGDVRGALRAIREGLQKITAERVKHIKDEAAKVRISVSREIDETSNRPRVIRVTKVSPENIPREWRSTKATLNFASSYNLIRTNKLAFLKDYIPIGIYLGWGDFSTLPKEYWQLYVTISKSYYEKALPLITHILRSKNIPHLVIEPEFYDRVEDGKYIIIFPRSSDEYFIAFSINDALHKMNARTGIIPKSPDIKKFEESMFVFTAWSNNFGDKKTTKIVTRPVQGVLEQTTPHRIVTRSDIINGNFKKGDGLAFFSFFGDKRVYQWGAILDYDSASRTILVTNLFGAELKIPLNFVSETPDLKILFNKHKKIEIRRFAEDSFNELIKSGRLGFDLTITDIERLIIKGFAIKGDFVYWSDEGKIFKTPLNQFLQNPNTERLLWNALDKHLIVIPDKIADIFPARVRGFAITESVYQSLVDWALEKSRVSGMKDGLAAFLGANDNGVVDKVYFGDTTLGSLEDFHKYLSRKYFIDIFHGFEFTRNEKVLAYFVSQGFDPRITLGELLVSHEYHKKDIFHIIKYYFEDDGLNLKVDLYTIDFSKLTKDEITNLKYIRNYILKETGSEVPLEDLPNFIRNRFPELINYLPVGLEVGEKIPIRIQSLSRDVSDEIIKKTRDLVMNGEILKDVKKSLDRMRDWIVYGSDLDSYFALRGQQTKYAFQYANNFYQEIKRKVDLWESLLIDRVEDPSYKKHKRIIETIREIENSIEKGPRATLMKINEARDLISKETSTLRKMIEEFQNLKDLRVKLKNLFLNLPEKRITRESLDNLVDNFASNLAEQGGKIPEEKIQKIFDELRDIENIKNPMPKVVSISQEAQIPQQVVQEFKEAYDNSDDTIKTISKTDGLSAKIEYIELTNRVLNSMTYENIEKLLRGEVVFVDDTNAIKINREGKLTLFDFRRGDVVLSKDGRIANLYTRLEPYLTLDYLERIVRANNYRLPDEVYVTGIIDGKLVEKKYDVRGFKKFILNEGTINFAFSRGLRDSYNNLIYRLSGEDLLKAQDDFFKIVGKPVYIDIPLGSKFKLFDTIDTDLLRIKYVSLDIGFSNIDLIKDDLEIFLKLNRINSASDLPSDKIWVSIGEDSYLIQRLDNNQVSLLKMEIDTTSEIAEISYKEVFKFGIIDGKVVDFSKLPKIEGGSVDFVDQRFIIKYPEFTIQQIGPGVTVVIEQDNARIFDIRVGDSRILYSTFDFNKERFLKEFSSKVDKSIINQNFVFGNKDGDIYNFVKTDKGWNVEFNGKFTGETLDSEQIKSRVRELLDRKFNPLEPGFKLTPVNPDFEIQLVSTPGYSKIFTDSKKVFELRNSEGVLKIIEGDLERVITPNEAKSLLQGAHSLEKINPVVVDSMAKTSYWKQFAGGLKILQATEFYPLVGPLDFIVFAGAYPILYSLAEDKSEMNRRLTYSFVENFAIEPASIIALRATSTGVRAALKGAVGGVGGAATLGFLAAVVAVETIAEDTIEEWLRANRLAEMGISIPNDLFSNINRVFAGYVDFLLSSPAENVLEKSMLFETVTSYNYKNLYDTASNKASQQILGIIGNRNDEFIRGIEKMISLHKDGPLGNYLDVIDGVEYIWFMEQGKFEVKYTNDIGNKVTVTYSITPNGIIPTGYREIGKVGFDILGCIGLGKNCCLDTSGCYVDVVKVISINERDLFKEAMNRADDLVVDRLEKDLNRIAAMKDLNEIIREAQKVADKINSDTNFIDAFGRPLTAVDIIALAKNTHKENIAQECFACCEAQEDVDACINSRSREGIFDIAYNQASGQSCNEVRGMCSSQCPENYEAVFSCNNLQKCCREKKYSYTYNQCEKLQGSCRLNSCGQGYIASGYCDFSNNVVCCLRYVEYENCAMKQATASCQFESIMKKYYAVVKYYGCKEGYGSDDRCEKGQCVEKYYQTLCDTGCKDGQCMGQTLAQANSYETCSKLGGGCYVGKCSSGYISGGYCDKDNGIYCCIETEDCSKKETRSECISEKTLRIFGYTCRFGFGSRESCGKGNCLEVYADVECKLGCNKDMGKCSEEQLVLVGTYVCPRSACSKQGDSWSCDLEKCSTFKS